MFNRIMPPLCLLLALAMVIVSFSMLAFGQPEASVQLHQARASGDETSVSALEAELKRQQNLRTIQIVFLLVGSGVMTISAFRCMRNPAVKAN